MQTFNRFLTIVCIAATITLVVKLYYPSAQNIVTTLSPIDFVEQQHYMTDDFEKPRVLIVFAGDDCPLCMLEADYWGQTNARYQDRVAFVGLSLGWPPEDLAILTKEYALSFPIRQDQTLYTEIEQWLRRRDIPLKTPMKLYIDDDNRLVGYEYGNKIEDDQKSFPERVADIFHLDDSSVKM